MKAQFGLVLNWAFVTQRSMESVIVEIENILVQKFRDVPRVPQIEIEIEFILYPAIQGFNDRIVSWSSSSRHGSQYVILTMGLAKSLGRVDGSLVGVEDYLGPMLFLFSCQLIQNSQTVIVGFVATLNICDTVSKDLVVKGIQKECPFPMLLANFQYRHI